jgi:hypothetical protein
MHCLNIRVSFIKQRNKITSQNNFSYTSHFFIQVWTTLDIGPVMTTWPQYILQDDAIARAPTQTLMHSDTEEDFTKPDKKGLWLTILTDQENGYALYFTCIY